MQAALPTVAVTPCFRKLLPLIPTTSKVRTKPHAPECFKILARMIH